jgi:hypothetical protein
VQTNRLKAAVGIASLALIALACGSSGNATPSSTAPAKSTTTVQAPTPTSPSTSGTPISTLPAAGGPCASSHLSLSLGQGQGAAGTVELPLVFTNTGTVACTLQGYPGVSAVGANGVQLGVPAVRRGTAPGPLVTLASGGTTRALFTFTNPLIQCSAPTTALGLRVYPPNQTEAAFVPTTAVGECSGPPNGNLFIYPIGDTSLQ